MSKLRQLIEAANRKCEMAWKVYSYNPEKDNELVDTSKAFDCIAAAQAHKRDILEKNPNYTVEIVAESMQKNESIEEQQDAIAKKIADAISAKFGWVLSKEGPYEEYYIGKGSNPINVKIKNDKDLQVQLRANEQPKTFKSIKDAIDFIKNNMNAYGFPGGSAFYGKLQSKANKNIERQKARDTYLHDISDSCQKNEDFYKYIDDVPTREIAKALKELGIKEPYATQKAKIADKLTKRFGLRRVPTPIEMTSILDALPYFVEESAQKSESKVNMSKLKNEIQAAVNKYFKDDKDLLEYVHIDTKKDKLGRDILEVRAELSYNDMVKLADHLDKIVTKYDRYAYFDQETSGIMTAVFESAQKNEDEQNDRALASYIASQGFKKSSAVFPYGFKQKDIIKFSQGLLANHTVKIVTPIYYFPKWDGDVAGVYDFKTKKLSFVLLKTFDKAKLVKSLNESAQKNEDLSKHPKLQEIWSRWKFNTKYGLHYTSNAKDTQAYLAKITKPNTFWLEDEDTGKAIVQGTPKDLINFMLSHKDTVEESAQKNESLRDLNLELADDTNAIAASADKIRQRFEYRTLQNQSYDEKQAEKIYLEIRRELEKAKKMIDACYNKIG